MQNGSFKGILNAPVVVRGLLFKLIELIFYIDGLLLNIIQLIEITKFLVKGWRRKRKWRVLNLERQMN